MANPKSPAAPNVLKNNAAKDDHIGQDGDFTFTIEDLLKNDPGGANKIDGHFFFGDTAADRDNQADYLTNHGIQDNGDGTYTLLSNATDFHYFTQIGNNGTWSNALVDVTAPPPPAPTAHDGNLVAKWDFENHTQAQGDNVGTPTGFWNLDQWAASHPGIYGEDADNFGFTSNIQVHGEDGHRALDTAGSPGNIFLQAIPTRDGVSGSTMPDLEAGKTYHAEVSILKQDYSSNPAMVAAGTEGTDPDAWVQFQFNDTVLNVHASDIHVGNEFVTFDTTFLGRAGEDDFQIQSHGTHDDSQGLLIDHIQIHEWLI